MLQVLLQQRLVADFGRMGDHQGAADWRVRLRLDAFLGPVTKLLFVFDEGRLRERQCLG